MPEEAPLVRITADSPLLEGVHLTQRIPARILNLFDNQSIRDICSVEKVKKLIGATQVTLTREYHRTFRDTGDFFCTQRRRVSAGEYLDSLRDGQRTDYVLTEYGTLTPLLPLFETPSWCAYRENLDGLPSVTSEMFIAGTGNVAHLHYDWDHRHVVLYQVFGRKRVTLFPPDTSPQLDPLLNTSLIDLENSSQARRQSLLMTLGGWEFILEPGEAVYIPPLMWHHIEYLEPGMSVTLRFGRTKYGRLFHECFHPNFQLQNFAAEVLASATLEGAARQWYAAMLSGYSQGSQKGFETYTRMQELFDQAYESFCGRSLSARMHGVFRKRQDEQIRKAITDGLLYV